MMSTGLGRRITSLATSVLFFLYCVGVRIEARADCQSCKPQIENGQFPVDYIYGTHTICIVGMSGIADALAAGVDYWNSHFEAHEIPIHVSTEQKASAEDCSSGSTKMLAQTPSPSSRFGETATNSNWAEAEIHVNPAAVAGTGSFSGVDSDDFTWLMAHELGHLLNFSDRSADCAAYSIMGDPRSFNSGPIGSLRCADEAKLNERTYQDVADDEYRAPTGDNCEDGLERWGFALTWCFGQQGWYICGYNDWFIECYYGPPLPEG
jgi:hypothetical protein